jgi:hypothetical protein
MCCGRTNDARKCRIASSDNPELFISYEDSTNFSSDSNAFRRRVEILGFAVSALQLEY